MPFFTGATRNERPTDRPYLSVLVFGTASDGIIGESRWFEDTEQAAFAYGGAATIRFNPSATDTAVTFPATFLPDDPTLSLDPRQLLYHVDPVTGHPVKYSVLGNQTATGVPIVLTFDPIGYDPSVAIYPGGLCLQTPSYARNGLTGNLLLPLISTLSELGRAGDTLLNVGGCRVGESWLPSTPASITAQLPTNTTGITVPLVLNCTRQGDGTTNDIYLTVQVFVTATSLIIDPGVLGLPYTRRTYLYTNYATWNDVCDAIQADYVAGLQPLRISSRIPRNDTRAKSAPHSSSTTTYTASYTDAGLGAPDLTTASGWLVVVAENDLPLDECPFLIFSGLTGQALAADPTSAQALLSFLDSNANTSDENPDLLLILPWSLTPPDPAVPYDASVDADALFNLVDAIGVQLASRLLILWGGMTQERLPLGIDGNSLQIPVAYAAAGALVRESAITSAYANPFHPQIQTIVASYVPPLLIQTAAEVPAPATPTNVPSPTALETLRVAGLSALTRSVGDLWRIHSPILLANRDPLRFTLCEAVIRENIQRTLDVYLGESNTASVRTQIVASLKTITDGVLAQTTAITQQISDFALELQETSIQETQLITSLSIEGRMALYGETSSITFQVNLQR